MNRICLTILLLLTLLAASERASAQEVIRVIAMPEASGDSSADGMGLTVDDELLRNWRKLRDDALAQAPR